MAFIFQDKASASYPLLGRLENVIYQLCHIDPHQEMNWKEYAKNILSIYQ